MTLLAFLWFVGFLFTVGFTKEPGDEKPYSMFTFFLWPEILGQAVRVSIKSGHDR